MSRFDNIIAQLQTTLAQILVLNGYRTDAGQRVHLEQEYRTDDPKTPCIILVSGDISDTLDGSTPPSLGEENHFLPVQIEGLIGDTESGLQGQALRQDILQAINKDRSFGGLVEAIEGSITSSTTLEESALEASGFVSIASVEFTLFYVTLFGAS